MFLLNAFSACLSLFSAKTLDKVASFLSYILVRFFKIRAKVLNKNLDIVYRNSLTNAQKQKTAQLSTASFLRTVFDFICAAKMYPQFSMDWINRRILDDALAKKRGVLVLAIHQSNWEYLLHIGAKTFAPVNIALKPVGGAIVSAWVRQRRAALQITEVSRKDKLPAWQLIIEALKRNELVAMVVDQRRRKGVLSPLFGMPALTNVSIFRIWRSYNAPIVPMYIKRTGLLTNQATFLPEIEVLNNDKWSEAEFFEHNAALLNKTIEQMILANPEEYFWLHDRWK